jgi:hypothetical protein
MLLRKVKDELGSLAGSFDLDLPRDATLDFVDVFIRATVTGAGGGADIGAHNIVDNLQLEANGINIFDQNFTGREHYYLSSALMGELMEQDAPDPSGGSVTLFTLLRLWLQNPRGLNPKRTRLNNRPFEDFRIRGSYAAATSAMYSGGTQAIAANAIQMQVYYGEVPGPGGDAVVQHKRFTYVMNGSEQIFDWRERGANLRAMLFEEFNSAGAPTDDQLTAAELIIDGKVRVLEPVPSLYLRAKSTYATQLSAAELPTGLSYHDLDPRSKGAPRVSLSGNNTQIKLTGVNTSIVNIIRSQTVGIETFGAGLRGRAIGGRR